MSLERSLTGRYNRSLFFESDNDIDLFVEDTGEGYNKIYLRIFKRVFSGSLKLNSVVPLGSRSNVIDKCREKQGTFKRPTLFVIDGDHFILTSEDLTEISGLFVLPFYCIENIFLDEAAIIEFLDFEEPKKDSSELQRLFDFENWRKTNFTPALLLALEYAVCFSLTPEIQTSAFPYKQLTSGTTGDLDLKKVRARVNNLKNTIIDKCGKINYFKMLYRILDQILDSKLDPIWFVSGKTIVFPMLNNRIRWAVKSSTQSIIIKQRIADACDVSILNSAKAAVVRET